MDKAGMVPDFKPLGAHGEALGGEDVLSLPDELDIAFAAKILDGVNPAGFHEKAAHEYAFGNTRLKFQLNYSAPTTSKKCAAALIGTATRAMACGTQASYLKR